MARFCKHGSEIPQNAAHNARRSPTCLPCHADYLADHARRSADRRANFTEEERESFARYLFEYRQMNSVRINLRRRLWRAERRLLELCGRTEVDQIKIQKLRLKLAQIGELVNIFAAW